MLFLLVFLLFVLFAVIFRFYFSLFARIPDVLFSTKERRELFDEQMRDNPLFTGFLKFQTLFLCMLFGYVVYGRYADFQHLRFFSIGEMIMMFFCVSCLFYLFKRSMYSLNGFVFNDKDSNRYWHMVYSNLFYLWGISLYVPVIWLLVDQTHLRGVLFLFALLYAVFRFTLVYMTVRIFYNKNTGILYLSSYLCAQEIVPLLFLYEGINYLYNTIEVSTLWH
ncbi:MAG: DUF4271 domain-containing protein [Tannerella sp.]|nr:DUF4271 domain-containing protein [Tannerella sp.]